jgi:hypothetical protein
MRTDQELIQGLRAELAGLHPPPDLVQRLRASAPRRRRRGRGLRVRLGWFGVAGSGLVAVGVVAAAFGLIGHPAARVGATMASPHPASSLTSPAAGSAIVTLRSGLILRGDGLGPARFGASAHRMRHLLVPLLGQPEGGDEPTDNCSIDQQLNWPLVLNPSTGRLTNAGELNLDFHRGRLVGYQWSGDLSATNETTSTRLRARTTAGLMVRDPLSVARHLYGSAFHISFAQGGSWQARTPSGTLRGYLSDLPTRHDARIASIAAGNVGCPAASP